MSTHRLEIADPQLVRSLSTEPAVHQIRCPRRRLVRPGRDRCFGPGRAAYAQLTYQTGDPILVEFDPMLAAKCGFQNRARVTAVVFCEVV